MPTKTVFCDVSVAGTVYRLGEGAKATVGIITLSDGRMGQIRVGMGGVVPTCWVVWLKPPKAKKAPRSGKKRRTGRDTCCLKCDRRFLADLDGCYDEKCLKNPDTCKGRTNGEAPCTVCRRYKE
jgi:hypothetical protein